MGKSPKSMSSVTPYKQQIALNLGVNSVRAVHDVTFSHKTEQYSENLMPQVIDCNR